jgi:hypothetical protein
VTKKSSTRVPKWALDYFTAALDRHDQLMRILDVSAAGIAASRGMPRLLTVLADIKKEPESERGSIKAAERRAALASSEVEAGFPTLNGFGVLALWSWLESFVVDLAVLWIQHKPGVLADLSSPRIRIEPAQLVSLKGQARARFIVEQIDRETSGSLKSGLGRFATLLGSVGFTVHLDEKARKRLLELQQVRNCLSHRFGIADQRLLAACPWIGCKVGEPVHVSVQMLHGYGAVAAELLLDLLYSTGDRFGADLRPTADEIEKSRASDKNAQT